MNRFRLKELLKHRDIIALNPPEAHCSWCYVSTNRKATHKVWSHEWLMYMTVCARHAVRIAWKRVKQLLELTKNEDTKRRLKRDLEFIEIRLNKLKRGLLY